ncbi:uncharacterized protein LOC119361746 [Triticum dicoccoides]|uniref:uncharacterized protein LOC119361746 n=1 Tax=Triticum dicoccoides TaxID=85692 RepID=UPI000E7B9B34|nr:uncharacterized protein LOC119361746 [Triticum dicoccoides]
MAGGALGFWNDWASQIGVLLSLFFQFLLHMFANIRRCKDGSYWLRFPLWVAYQLSDSTATYAAGQLLFSGATKDHHLIAFWVPFLLLHLGGPDNITAYALEDSKLWGRHLLSLLVQVLGAGYVLYRHIIGSGTLLMVAAILISVVGVAKYGERTWALRSAKFSNLQSSLKVRTHDMHHQQFYTEHQDWYNDGDPVLQHAHSLFHICKRGIVDCVIAVDDSDSENEVDSQDIKIIHGLLKDREQMWRVMEMELSLMYDILYTKASAVHCWFGYCIRVIAPLAIATSLVLFQLSSKDDYSLVDVVITYILLGGALVLETKSLLVALGSSWAFAFLCATQWDWLRHSALCAGRWHRLRHTLFFLRWSWLGKMTIMTGSSRRWSGTMGQRNMVRSCTRQVDPMNRSLGKLCKTLSLGEWWDRRYLWTIDVSEKVKKPAEKWILSRRSVGDMNTMGLRRTKWGELALNEEDYPGLLKDLEGYHGVDFHESVISWHIATDLILAEIDRRGDHVSDDQVELVSVLSNYMMFLLVDSPDMLPGLPQKWLYEQTCKQLKKICTKHIAGSAGNSFWTMLKNLFRPHHHRGWKPSELEKEIAIDILSEFERSNVSNPRLTYARAIAVKLLHRKEDVVYALLLLWVDFLAHAANRCNREAHARKLGSGGELLTVIWLYQEHLHQVKEEIRKGQNPV